MRGIDFLRYVNRGRRKAGIPLSLLLEGGLCRMRKVIVSVVTLALVVSLSSELVKAQEERVVIRGHEVKLNLDDRHGCKPMCGTIPCSAPPSGITIVVSAYVPSSHLLRDDEFAKAVLEKGKEYYLQKCPTFHPKVRIVIKHPGTIGHLVYDAGGLYVPEDGYRKLREYPNRHYEAVQSQRQMEVLQSKIEEEKRRMKKAEAEKEAARQGRWNDFVRKYGIQEMIEANALMVNPFVYQGKTVAIHTNFLRMVSPDTGLFANGNIIASGLPRDLMRTQSVVVLVGRVTGTTGQAPQLKFVGVHFCKDYGCSDLLAQR